MAWFQEIVTSITEYLIIGGPIVGILVILLESIFPALPLGVFITLNMEAFGKIFGFILSWSATCLGCILSYFVFSKWVDRLLQHVLKKHQKKLKKLEKRIYKIPFSHLVLLVALPFTPAFLINIACGLSKMSTKKFIIAILLGKLSIVFFWGFVGTSLIESVTDMKTIIIIALLLIGTYILSKIVSRKMKID